MRNFPGDDVFDPDTVSVLMAAFDGAWQSIRTSGVQLSEKQSELVRKLALPSLFNDVLGKGCRPGASARRCTASLG